MDLKKWSPWNWFKKEDEREANPGNPVPVQRYDNPVMRLHQEVDRMFDEAFRGFGMPSLFEPLRLTNEFRGMLKPKLDIAETNEQYIISVEVPGVDEKDIQVSLQGDTLTISGEKKQEQEHKDANVHSIERSYGSFQRVLSLPSDAEANQVKAKFKNGVLTLTVLKNPAQRSEGRLIEIEKG